MMKISISIPILNLSYNYEDLSNGNGRVTRYGTLAQNLLDLLKSRGLHEPNLHYRGFRADRISTMKRKGTDRDAKSEIWFPDIGTTEHTLLAKSRIVYATKEGERIQEIDTETCRCDHLEDALSYSTSRANQRGVSALAVYKGSDIAPIRDGLGEYFLKEGAMPVAIIKLFDVSTVS
jgi:hypothetical protein